MITTGSGFLCHLVALSGCQLTTIEINLHVFGKITYHLMICRMDGFHVMQPSASQYGIEWG